MKYSEMKGNLKDFVDNVLTNAPGFLLIGSDGNVVAADNPTGLNLTINLNTQLKRKDGNISKHNFITYTLSYNPPSDGWDTIASIEMERGREALVKKTIDILAGTEYSKIGPDAMRLRHGAELLSITFESDNSACMTVNVDKINPENFVGVLQSLRSEQAAEPDMQARVRKNITRSIDKINAEYSTYLRGMTVKDLATRYQFKSNIVQAIEDNNYKEVLKLIESGFEFISQQVFIWHDGMEQEELRSTLFENFFQNKMDVEQKNAFHYIPSIIKDTAEEVMLSLSKEDGIYAQDISRLHAAALQKDLSQINANLYHPNKAEYDLVQEYMDNHIKNSDPAIVATKAKQGYGTRTVVGFTATTLKRIDEDIEVDVDVVGLSPAVLGR